MRFSVHDRIILLNIVPNRGDITTIKIIKDFIDEIGFTPEEHKLLGIKRNGNDFNWKENVNLEPKDYEVNDVITKIIRDALDDLNQKKQLQMEFIPLYEKFMEVK